MLVLGCVLFLLGSCILSWITFDFPWLYYVIVFMLLILACYPILSDLQRRDERRNKAIERRWHCDINGLSVLMELGYWDALLHTNSPSRRSNMRVRFYSQYRNALWTNGAGWLKVDLLYRDGQFQVTGALKDADYTEADCSILAKK